MNTPGTGTNRIFSFTAAILFSSVLLGAEQCKNPEAMPILERNNALVIGECATITF